MVSGWLNCGSDGFRMAGHKKDGRDGGHRWMKVFAAGGEGGFRADFQRATLVVYTGQVWFDNYVFFLFECVFWGDEAKVEYFTRCRGSTGCSVWRLCGCGVEIKNVQNKKKEKRKGNKKYHGIRDCIGLIRLIHFSCFLILEYIFLEKFFY